jgi:LysM repeat protein
MDTISRENNSMLPVGAVIVGVIALLLGGYAAISVSKANRAIADQQAKLERLEALETRVDNAAQQAGNAVKNVQDLTRSTQNAFNDIGPLIGSLQVSVNKLEEAAKKPAPAPAAAAKKGSEPAVAGPGEYVVKAGDSGMKIATANGVSISDLQAVNPGVNWNRITPGQKLKLPKK